MQHVFLVGAKSLGAYGGYETFVNKLTEYHQTNTNMKYHVACKANGDGSIDVSELSGVADIVRKKNHAAEFTYHNAHCFQIPIPEKLGAVQAIYYDVTALKRCCEMIREQNISHPIVYIMACRIGPFMKHFYKEIHKLGGKVYLNPDGHEWKRSKWSAPVRAYWKWSEQRMVKYCDLVICDSVHIERYIHEQYDGKGIRGRNPRTTFIAYGAETRQSKLSNDSKLLADWYREKGLKAKEYYLVVGRFVPENNYETIIREFMKSHSKKDLAVITNENPRFFEELDRKLRFRSDSRIKFVGTVYDQELLMKIRENAYGYIHGHEVGGTNPSLLEAMGNTDLNLLLNVGFNKEVAEETAVYWNKADGNLARLIEQADEMDPEERKKRGAEARKRIAKAYSWMYISERYEKIFCGQKKHILFLHSSAELYGSDRSLLYLIKGLDKKKYQLTVLLPCDGPLAAELKKIDGVKVDFFEVAVLRRKNLSFGGMLRYGRDFISSCHEIKKRIKEQHVDVVYTNVAVVFPGAIAAARSRNCKSVWHIREIIKSKTERAVVSMIVNHFSDVIIANSKATGEAICKDSKKLQVVYNAVDEKADAVVWTEKRAVVVGMAGRINRWKGQKLFIDMAELVHQERPFVKFVIAGSAYAGEEYLEEELKQYIEKKGLSDVVSLLGQVEDMDHFYQSLDLFVLPSVQPEPFGLVVIEAMEKKLPVVATAHGGPLEIIQDGEDGYLVPFENEDVMAERCMQLCDDWNLRKRMGEKAQEKKRRMFSVEKTVQEIDRILEGI